MPRSTLFCALAATLSLTGSALAQDTPKTLFTNVNVFDGVNEKRIMNANVLVEGKLIRELSTAKLDAPGATVIDGGGRTLMPGLVDAHWHTMFNFAPISKVLGTNFGYLNIAAADASRKTLMRGFTTVRDVGGNSFGVKRAIDEGLAEGPRIHPSGPYIGQTSGHGDFRGPNDVPENMGTPLDYQQRVGNTLIADGVPEVIKRTREAVRRQVGGNPTSVIRVEPGENFFIVSLRVEGAQAPWICEHSSREVMRVYYGSEG